MCEYCGQSYCPERCPNAKEPVAKETCNLCGEGIFHGDEYAVINEEHYHVECLASIEKNEILKMLGIDVKIADESEY